MFYVPDSIVDPERMSDENRTFLDWIWDAGRSRIYPDDCHKCGTAQLLDGLGAGARRLARPLHVAVSVFDGWQRSIPRSYRNSDRRSVSDPYLRGRMYESHSTCHRHLPGARA